MVKESSKTHWTSTPANGAAWGARVVEKKSITSILADGGLRSRMHPIQAWSSGSILASALRSDDATGHSLTYWPYCCSSSRSMQWRRSWSKRTKQRKICGTQKSAPDMTSSHKKLSKATKILRQKKKRSSRSEKTQRKKDRTIYN